MSINYICMININKYEKALQFLEVGCGCGCSAKLSKKEFAELHEAFKLCQNQNKMHF